MKLEIHKKREAKLDLLQHFIYIGEENIDAAEWILGRRGCAREAQRNVGDGANASS